MASWTFWLIAAVVVFVLEMFIGTVYLLVLAAALAGTAVAAFLGVGTTACLLIASLFSGVGIVYVYYARRARSLKRDVSRDNDLDLGERVVVESRLAEDLWRVQYRGTLWEARGITKQDFQTGQQAKICGKDGIVLLIEST